MINGNQNKIAPFFIVGPQRSGTTLLRLMLAEHSEIIVPPESHYIADLIDFEQNVGPVANYKEDIILWLIGHDRLADFDFSSQVIHELLDNLYPFSIKNITLTLFGHYTKKYKKSRWGDKTPRYRNIIPEISNIFPSAKFILLIRDGRDTSLSTFTVPFGPIHLADCANLWKQSIKAAKKGGDKISKNNFMVVIYEELITDSDKVLKQICAFIGEDYQQSMLDYHKNTSKLVPSWEGNWHEQTRKPVTNKNIGKWKTQFLPREIKLIETIAGDELRKYNYQISNPNIVLKDTIWLYFQLVLFHLRQGYRLAKLVVKKLHKKGMLLKYLGQFNN